MKIHKIIIFLVSIHFFPSGILFCFEQERSFDYLKVKDEIKVLRSKNCQWKVLVTESDAPVLKNLIDKYITQFSAKAGMNAKLPVYVDFNTYRYDNYGFFYNGSSFLLGDGLLEILVSNNFFEKYFAALFAHEYGHFCLNHETKSILSQEIDADKFAIKFVGDPKQIIDAHIFHFLCMFLAPIMIECLGFDKNSVNNGISKIMFEFVNLKPGLEIFYNAKKWESVSQLLLATCLKLGLDIQQDLFIEKFASNLVQVKNNVLSKEYLFCYIPRILEFLQHPFAKADHPSPKYLSNLHKN